MDSGELAPLLWPLEAPKGQGREMGLSGREGGWGPQGPLPARQPFSLPIPVGSSSPWKVHLTRSLGPTGATSPSPHVPGSQASGEGGRAAGREEVRRVRAKRGWRRESLHTGSWLPPHPQEEEGSLGPPNPLRKLVLRASLVPSRQTPTHPGRARISGQRTEKAEESAGRAHLPDRQVSWVRAGECRLPELRPRRDLRALVSPGRPGLSARTRGLH